ncbi:DUF1190 domain-containing protein [uncultured Psychrosphaera sp.]|uniref:DUF1190 domain-containing protein n=1 Tax=uncultured Psychrosphaera sp. TaxID=1403522 RepID=UPI0026286536|nr:DUF1190 domain-containing protein [uncultured Psychrosphaera sp.]
MKRSQFINLDLMRKVKPKFLLRPIALGITAALLSACGNNQEVKVVSSVDDCVSNTSLDLEECEIAYKSALAESEKTSPKYKTMNACVSEFGPDQCVQSQNQSIFMPLMAGFMINELLFNRNRNSYGGYYNPVYRYNRPYSSHHNSMMLADGTSIGKYGKSSYNVSKSATKQKPMVTRTVSRGGFGSVASAKSNWGGGSKSRGWGG